MNNDNSGMWAVVTLLILAGAGVIAWRALSSAKLADAAQSAGAAAANAVAGVATGAVLATGDNLGIPRTDKSQCQLDLEAGRIWDASFSCPAPDFISGTWKRLTT